MNPYMKGKITKQAHVAIPEGTFEEEHGRRGFYGKSAHLYHTHAPTGWIRFEGKLRPHCFDCNKLEPTDLKDPLGSPIAFLGNQDVTHFGVAPLGPDAVLFPKRRRRRTDLCPSRAGHDRDRFRPHGFRKRGLPRHPASCDLQASYPRPQTTSF